MSEPSERATRRNFLVLAGALVARGTAAWLGLGLAPSAARASAQALTKSHLEKSPFVYISPLLANGQESTCHAELWYAWIDGSVVVIVSSDGWKARALDRGLDRARIWIGDQGRWKTWLGGRNEAFRKAPSFDARAERIEEASMLERLLSVYEEKYPNEIASWRDRMRRGFADGSRVLLRYRPIEALDL